MDALKCFGSTATATLRLGSMHTLDEDSDFSSDDERSVDFSDVESSDAEDFETRSFAKSQKWNKPIESQVACN